MTVSSSVQSSQLRSPPNEVASHPGSACCWWKQGVECGWLLPLSLLCQFWSNRKQMALKSWKVEGSFVKGLFPKALAGPAGDRARSYWKRRSRVDGAACGEGAPVTWGRGAGTPRLVSTSSCWTVGCLLTKSTELGLLLELGNSGQWFWRKTLLGPLLLSSQVEAVGKAGPESWAWKFLLEFCGPSRCVILTFLPWGVLLGFFRDACPTVTGKHPQFPSCV